MAVWSRLQSIVIVSQEEPELTVFRRSGQWIAEVISGQSAVLSLPEIGIDIPLADLYR